MLRQESILKRYHQWKNRNRKVFVIGFNKTGSTSTKKALEDLGYTFGHQRSAVLLLDDLSQGDVTSLIRYCRSAQAFKDLPFSCPGIYKILDKEFPESKYILTIRDSPEQWFTSLVSFHSKILKTPGVPSHVDLATSNKGPYQGFMLKAVDFMFPGLPLYCKDGYMNVYDKHNKDVISYFRYRKQDLLVLNVSSATAYKEFCAFLGHQPLYDRFPWENKT